MGWTWATGTPRERANMVRSHGFLKESDLRDLFLLTRKGLGAILTSDQNRRLSGAKRIPKSQ